MRRYIETISKCSLHFVLNEHEITDTSITLVQIYIEASEIASIDLEFQSFFFCKMNIRQMIQKYGYIGTHVWTKY